MLLFDILNTINNYQSFILIIGNVIWGYKEQQGKLASYFSRPCSGCVEFKKLFKKGSQTLRTFNAFNMVGLHPGH
jgi:hypothetical protein